MYTPLPFGPQARRWALAAAALLGIGTAAQAQSLNYNVANATTLVGTFTSIATTGTPIATASTDNANSAATGIGFTFNYNGLAFTQFVLNTNGFIKLGATAPSSASLFYTPENTIAGDVISSTAAADVNIIAPFACDLESSTTPASYRVQTTGTTGSRVCTIQWSNVRDKLMTNTPQYANFSFQVKLYEGTNRIELIYGSPTAGTGTDAFRYAVAGIKGSGNASGQTVLFTKASAQTWDLATALTGNYIGNTLNYRQTVPPVAGRTFRFDALSGTDAAVSTVYTLGRISQTYASPHVVRAVLTNNGGTTLTNVPVMLTVTGATPFSNTQTVASLATGTSTTVTFPSYALTASGTNTVTVTANATGDTNAANNSASSQQVVSAGRLAYTDPAGTTAGGLGSGAANSILYVKYTVTGATTVTAITPTFDTTVPGTAGDTYQVQVYAATGTGGNPAATPLYTSPARPRPVAGGADVVTITPTAVSGSFYVATKQLAANNIGLAYQTEAPLRTGTFLFSPDGIAFTDLSTSTFPARLAIEAAVGAVTCASPTNAAVGSITNTTASVSFTAAAGASNYTVTATPATGPATTVIAPNSPANLTGLTAGTTYNVSVVTNCTNGQTSAPATTTFTTTGGAAAPANDLCANATTITCGQTLTGTTVGATSTGEPTTACAVGGLVPSTSPGVFYRFVGNGQTVTFSTCSGPTATTGDTKLFVYTGTCAALTCVGADDDDNSGIGTCTNTAASILNVATVTGTTYYVLVQYYNLAGSANVTGPFGLTATCAAPPAAPANDLCANATTITCGQTLTGTTVNATTTGDPTTACSAVAGSETPSNSPGVFYRFVGNGNGITLSTCAGPSATAGDTKLFVYTGSCTNLTCVASNDEEPTGTCTNASASTVTFNSVSGTTYYVMVQFYTTGAPVTGAFGLSATCSAAPFCLTPADAAFANITNVSAQITFTPVAGNTSYIVTYTPTAGGATTTLTPTTSPVTITGLLPNTSYDITFQAVCASGGTATALAGTITTLAGPPPANDNPTGAVALTVSPTCVPTNGTNVNASTTPPNGYANPSTTPATCGVAVSPVDVWYSFTTLGGQTTATVTVTGNPAGQIRVFSASSNAGPFTQVGCNAGTGNNLVSAPVALTGLTPNTTYYVSVAGFGSGDTTGPFTICVTGTGTVPCPAVTGLSAGSITATSASLTFTPAAGATNYTVVVTPAGGTATTQTAAGSPVALTGLTASTTYNIVVRTNCAAGQTSGDVTTTFTTLAPPCLAVTNLAASGVTTTTATLTFTGAAGATGYTVTYTPQGGSPTSQPATGSPVNLAGLTAGTQYTATVTTNCAAGQMSPPATTTFNTSNPTCPAVTNLVAGSVTTTGATLTFTGAAGATGYVVTYTPQGGAPTSQPATGSPVNLAGLTAGTQYTATVTTTCAAGQVSSAVATTFTTTTPPCPAVTALAVGSITTTGASVSFTPAAGATGYTLTYTPQGGAPTSQPATGSPVTLAGLTPTTMYTVTVTTNCAAGQTSPAASVSFTTATPCLPVTNLAAGSTTPTGTTLTFTAPTAGATGFTVMYTAAGGPTQTQNATGSPVVLTGLTPGTMYTATVTTTCGAGQTSSVATTTFSTPFPPCLTATGLAAANVATTTATLNFTAPAGATGYTVTVTPQGGTPTTQPATASPVSLTSLLAGTQYAVSVVTNCAGGQTSPAATTTFTTTAPAPTAGAATLVTDTGASIGFTGAPGATSYTVTYAVAGGPPTVVTVTAAPATLTGLTPNTAYTVTVVANYPGGATSAPLTVNFTTRMGTATRTALAGGQVLVFPNPAHHAFTLALPALGTTRTARLELVNALGQVVRTQNLTLAAGGTQVQVPVTELATGLYSVRVKAGAETATVRLVVE